MQADGGVWSHHGGEESAAHCCDFVASWNWCRTQSDETGDQKENVNQHFSDVFTLDVLIQLCWLTSKKSVKYNFSGYEKHL